MLTALYVCLGTVFRCSQPYGSNYIASSSGVLHVSKMISGVDDAFTHDLLISTMLQYNTVARNTVYLGRTMGSKLQWEWCCIIVIRTIAVSETRCNISRNTHRSLLLQSCSNQQCGTNYIVGSSIVLHVSKTMSGVDVALTQKLLISTMPKYNPVDRYTVDLGSTMVSKVEWEWCSEILMRTIAVSETRCNISCNTQRCWLSQSCYYEPSGTYYIVSSTVVLHVSETTFDVDGALLTYLRYRL